MRSVKHAIGPSFGSLSFGAAILTFVQLARNAMEQWAFSLSWILTTQLKLRKADECSGQQTFSSLASGQFWEAFVSSLQDSQIWQPITEAGMGL